MTNDNTQQWIDEVTEACNLIAEFITTIGYLPDRPLLLVEGGEDALDSLIQRAHAFLGERRELVTVTFPTYTPEPGPRALTMPSDDKIVRITRRVDALIPALPQPASDADLERALDTFWFELDLPGEWAGAALLKRVLDHEGLEIVKRAER